MRALLDVNVLVALLDAAHVHHRTASAWLGKHIGAGWASCPLTQNGCLRLLSSPSYPSPLPLMQVAERLERATADASHRFWPDAISLLDPRRIGWRHLLTGRQLTDAYLLALAVTEGGRFVTLDRGVALAAVGGARLDHLVVLG
jgi:toxin-antitoxin system PIN domain toxin